MVQVQAKPAVLPRNIVLSMELAHGTRHCHDDPQWSSYPDYIKNDVDMLILSNAYAILVLLCGITMVLWGSILLPLSFIKRGAPQVA